MGVVTVYMVRHGETQANREGIMQGQLDTQLNAAGEDQAQRTADALDRVRFAAAHSSDLARAVKTAQTILEKHPGVALQTHEALRERYMGDMQGVAMSEWRGPMPENMEPAAAFVQRAEQWWKDVVVRRCLASARAMQGSETVGSADSGYNVLVVSHGGLLHVLLQSLIESRKVKAARGVEENGKGTVVLFGDTTHLEDELVEGNVDIVE